MAERGFEVWGVDQAPLESGFEGARQLSVNLTDEAAVGKLVDESQPDAIVHLAAQSSVRLSFDDPIGTIRNNTLPALFVLDKLRARTGACRLLAIGSADEYGPVNSVEQLPLRESDPVNPNNPYALAKSIQNQYCRSYAELFGLDVVVTRSFNHTGAGQTDIFALPNFARQIGEIKLGRREPVIRVGNLDVKRDFLDVRDVCEAYVALLERGTRGETYNVCSGNTFVIRDLLDKLCELSRVDVDVEVDSDRVRPVDTPELRGDNGKIRADTGWSPRIPIEDTLRSLLDYWEQTVNSQ
jgi:GDP-4-dehydro-6-deoxy-D-mannose reductase